MAIRLAVFDIAGTTVDDSSDAVAVCVCAALARAGVNVGHEAVDPVMGMPKPLAIATLLSEARSETPEPAEVDQVHREFQQRMIEHYRHAPDIRETAGASDAFDRLRRSGVRVAFDTGFDRAITDVIFQRVGWALERDFDDSICSDEVSEGRPSPEMIDVLRTRAKITRPQEVAKVGDSVSDIEEGLAAGCGLVAAIAGERTREALRATPHVHEVHNLAEFVLLVEQAGSIQATR